MYKLYRFIYSLRGLLWWVVAASLSTSTFAQNAVSELPTTSVHFETAVEKIVLLIGQGRPGTLGLDASLKIFVAQENLQILVLDDQPPTPWMQKLLTSDPKHFKFVQLQNVTDGNEVVAFVQKLTLNKKVQILGATTNAEKSVRANGEVNETFGLPGLNREVSMNVTLKHLTRELWNSSGLPFVNFLHVQSLLEAREHIESRIRAGASVIVKPSASASSVGVRKISSIAEIDTQIRSAEENYFGNSGDKHYKYNNQGWVVEDFIPNILEVMVDSETYTDPLTGRTETKIGSIFFKTPVTAKYNFAEIVFILDPELLQPQVRANIEAMTPKAIKALGIKSGHTHLEFVVRKDFSVVPIDIGARPGGNPVSYIVKLATGFDFFLAQLYRAIGKSPFNRWVQPPNYPQQVAVERDLYSPIKGKYQGAILPQFPHGVTTYPEKLKGASITTTQDYLEYIIALGKNSVKMISAVDQVAPQIKLKIDVDGKIQTVDPVLGSLLSTYEGWVEAFGADGAINLKLVYERFLQIARLSPSTSSKNKPKSFENEMIQKLQAGSLDPANPAKRPPRITPATGRQIAQAVEQWSTKGGMSMEHAEKAGLALAYSHLGKQQAAHVEYSKSTGLFVFAEILSRVLTSNGEKTFDEAITDMIHEIADPQTRGYFLSKAGLFSVGLPMIESRLIPLQQELQFFQQAGRRLGIYTVLMFAIHELANPQSSFAKYRRGEIPKAILEDEIFKELGFMFVGGLSYGAMATAGAVSSELLIKKVLARAIPSANAEFMFAGRSLAWGVRNVYNPLFLVASMAAALVFEKQMTQLDLNLRTASTEILSDPLNTLLTVAAGQQTFDPMFEMHAKQLMFGINEPIQLYGDVIPRLTEELKTKATTYPNQARRAYEKVFQKYDQLEKTSPSALTSALSRIQSEIAENEQRRIPALRSMLALSPSAYAAQVARVQTWPKEYVKEKSADGLAMTIDGGPRLTPNGPMKFDFRPSVLASGIQMFERRNAELRAMGTILNDWALELPKQIATNRAILKRSFGFLLNSTIPTSPTPQYSSGVGKQR